MVTSLSRDHNRKNASFINYRKYILKTRSEGQVLQNGFKIKNIKWE